MLGRFLRQHGHRARIEGELRFPRWSEAPEQVVAALVGYLQDPSVRDPREVEAATRRQLRERESALDARLSGPQRWILHRLAARAKKLVRLRDNGQHNIVRLLLPIRRLCAELGNRWAERDWLAQPDDIFFLHWTELDRVIAMDDPTRDRPDLRTVVAARRAAYDYWFSVPAPDVVGADGRPITLETYEDASETRLVGIAASGGRVSGVARIAHSPAEAALLQRGEILVARS